MKKINWKNLLPDLLILSVFIIASILYFQPALQGKIIASSDGINGRAAVQESFAYHEQTGDYTSWTK